jgi:hypothetical protein
MGKYDGVVKQYPRAVPAPGPFREKVEGLKHGLVDASAYALAASYAEAAGKLPGAIVDRTPDGLARLYIQLIDAKKAADALTKPVHAMAVAVEELMLQEFEARGLDELVIEGRTVKFDNGLSTKTTDPAAFYEWVREAGLEGLLTMHAGRIGSIVKERILEGQTIPPGIEVKSWRQAWPRVGSEAE